MRLFHRTAAGIVLAASSVAIAAPALAAERPDRPFPPRHGIERAAERRAELPALSEERKAEMLQRHQERREQHAVRMAERLAIVDFSAAGVEKPAFWDQLMTWLRSDDARALGKFMMEQRRAEAPQRR